MCSYISWILYAEKLFSGILVFPFLPCFFLPRRVAAKVKQRFVVQDPAGVWSKRLGKDYKGAFSFTLVLNSEVVIQRGICISELILWHFSWQSSPRDKYSFHTELQMLRRYSNLFDLFDFILFYIYKKNILSVMGRKPPDIVENKLSKHHVSQTLLQISEINLIFQLLI